MIDIKKRIFDSKTLEYRNSNRNKVKDKNRNKYSKSQKCLKLNPNELTNNFDCTLETIEFNNSLSSSEKKESKKMLDQNKKFYLNNSQISELYQEEINYNIDDTTKNNHETTDSSKIKKENEYQCEYEISNSDEIDNNDNINKNSDNNYSKKQYCFEEKNKYIKELEKKIESQENIIYNLLDFKNTLCGKTSHNFYSKRVPVNYFRFSSLGNKFNNECCKNKDKKKKEEDDMKNKSNERKLSNKINNNNIDKKRNSIIDKYNILYSKYLQLSNDFKYLNNNNLINGMSQIKNECNNLQEKNTMLNNKIEEKNKIIEKLKNENNYIKQKYDTNCKIQYILGGEEEKDVIKNLKQQVETFKKDLVLSQAMVNSLKSEIQQLNEKNKNLQDKINIKYNEINTNNLNKNNMNDKYIFAFNENSPPNMALATQFNMNKNFNIDDIKNDIFLNLKTSLNNKNKLLSKVLAENNELRKKLKNFDSFLPEFNYTSKENNEDEVTLKKLKKFEEKYKYFYEYIKGMKKSIEKIYEDIRIIFNKYNNKIGNKILSDKFIFELYELRKEYNHLKEIDMYNLDIADDKKCIKLYKNIVKLLSDELENVMKDKKNEILRNPGLYDTKSLNLNVLNTVQNNNNLNNDNNILIDYDNKYHYNTTDMLFNDKNKNNTSSRNSIKNKMNDIYNFKYIKNSEDFNKIENNYKTFY